MSTENSSFLKKMWKKHKWWLVVLAVPMLVYWVFEEVVTLIEVGKVKKKIKDTEKKDKKLKKEINKSKKKVEKLEKDYAKVSKKLGSTKTTDLNWHKKIQDDEQ